MIEKIYATIDTIILYQKKARKDNDYLGLMTNAEALLEYLPELINYAFEQEAEYRKFEAKLSDEKDEFGKRYSGSYCETKAKATDFYANWQRAKNFMELMYEMVNMAKALGRGVNNEFNAH